jgi:hypothetical protein
MIQLPEVSPIKVTNPNLAPHFTFTKSQEEIPFYGGRAVTPRVTTSLIAFISVLFMHHIHWLIES